MLLSRNKSGMKIRSSRIQSLNLPTSGWCPVPTVSFPILSPGSELLLILGHLLFHHVFHLEYSVFTFPSVELHTFILSMLRLVYVTTSSCHGSLSIPLNLLTYGTCIYKVLYTLNLSLTCRSLSKLFPCC